ncbi:MAG: PKD domain-containing protein [Chloroflexi bacterium]|nr:PKD domain-containing protein [Chloroflexota bacterium]
MDIQKFWRESSPALRIIILVGLVAVLAAITLIALSLSNRTEPPAPTPTPGKGVIIIAPPTPAPGKPKVTAITNAPIHNGPGKEYPQIAVLFKGASATAVGVSTNKEWWAITFPGAVDDVGWVEAALVTAENADGLPIVSPPPVPTPTAAPPVEITDWKGEYFNNRDLQGDPVVVRNDPVIDFNWNGAPPADGLPGENWSARWTVTREAAAGTYRFNVWVDDGVRIWVDDALIIDGWAEGDTRNYTADVNVTKGTHTVRVEYFQAAGASSIKVDIGFIDEYPDWKAEYFDKPNVEGEPVMVRNDSSVNFNWGNGAPANGLPADNYSVRWSRRAYFEAGNFIFTTQVAGGVRLWLDGRLLIDDWNSQPMRLLEAESGDIEAGYHDLRVDFFKTTGDGAISVNWQLKPDEPLVPPTAVISGPAQARVGEQVQYSGASSTAGPGRELVRYQWDFGDGAVAEGMEVTHVFNQAGTYNVTLVVNDDKGQSNTAVLQTNVGEIPKPPTAVINAPTTTVAGQPVTFDGSSSFGERTITGYRWDFGDGFSAEGAVVQYTYQTPGTYLVTLTVTDEANLTGQSQIQMTVQAPSEPTPTTPPLTTPTPGATATPPPVLEGVEWRLADTLPFTELTALFLNGTVSGSAGCNTYSGNYALNGAQITIQIETVSRQICEPEIMEQEQAFLDALAGAQRYQIIEQQLQMESVIEGEITILTFAAQAQSR